MKISFWLIPIDSPFFPDLDGDGAPDELVVTASREKAFADESEPEGYTGFGIYTGSRDTFYYEDLFACDFQPYYVKTASGGHYLYVFCKEDEEAFPMFTLRVFDLSGGRATDVGKMYARPGYISDGSYRVPTDPGLFTWTTLTPQSKAWSPSPSGRWEYRSPTIEAFYAVPYGVSHFRT